MDWVHETHRKLYTRVDGKWARHAASTRGLAALLVIYADEDGCIYLGTSEKPGEAIARVIQAHASERKRVLADVDALLEERPDDPPFLVHESARQRVRIRNFAAAQGIIPQTPEERSAARSREAERAAAYRERKKLGKIGGQETDGHPSRHDGDRDERDDRHDASRDGDRDEPRDGDRDARRDERDADDRDGDSLAGARAGAAAHTRAGTVPSVPSVPSSSPPPPPRGCAREEQAAGALTCALDAASDLFGGAEPEAAATIGRLAKKLAALEPENEWQDLEAEIGEWVAHVRKEVAAARQKGAPWTHERALTELEAKAGQRIRYRPKDAATERQRARDDRSRAPKSERRSGATSDGSIDWAAVEAGRPRRSRGDS